MKTMSFFQAKSGLIIPTDLANLRQWYKADAGVTKDGSNLVSVWADQSGNAVNLNLTSSGTNRPSWVDGVIDGKPVIRFNGSQLMFLTNYDTNHFLAGNTMFLVFKKETIDGPMYSFTYAGGHQYIADGNVYYDGHSYIKILGVFSEGSLYWPDGDVFTNWGVINAKVSNSQATININNVNIGTKACTNMEVIGYTFGGSIFGYYSICDFSEIIYYDRELSDTEINQVYAYLKAKYPSLP